MSKLIESFLITGPKGFRRLRPTEFLCNRHMKEGTDRCSPQETSLVIISVRSCVEIRVIVRPEGLSQWKIPVTPSGFQPAIFRLVAQYLNQLLERVPTDKLIVY